MDDQIRGITISSLMKRSDDRKIIQNYVNDQVRVIDTKIVTSHASGGNFIEHELPSNFNINNMEKADAQTMIYSELITTYVKKGFTKVYIDLGSKPKLFIRWLNGMDKEERQYRQKIIHKHELSRTKPFIA